MAGTPLSLSLPAQGWYDAAHRKRKFAPKPLLWDEVMYEGDIGAEISPPRLYRDILRDISDVAAGVWGGLTAGQQADRYWWGLAYGTYTTHGETLRTKPIDDDDQAPGYIAMRHRRDTPDVQRGSCVAGAMVVQRWCPPRSLVRPHPLVREIR